MKVADSSYLVEGLLKNQYLFENESLVTLDLAVYETANSVWKHEFLLKDIKNGVEYLSIIHGLIETEKIQLLHASKDCLHSAYLLASKNKRSIYDTVFVALAIELDSELATFDKWQAELYDKMVH